MDALMRALFFRVSRTDPAALSAGTPVPTGVALLASWLPSRRADRVNPVEALKEP